MDQHDEKITLLLSMGFPDVQAITRVLRLSNGDLNDAVTYLTEQPISSYNTVEDLTDVDMTDSSLIRSDPPPYSQDSFKGGNNLEFPMTHLYELESRLYIESWVIPYKKDESLAQCLIAATKLSQEGLCETDENCHRFFDRCLPECFQKLLNSVPVRRWSSDIQEGIYNMVELLIDLIVARLKTGCIPEVILRHTFAMVFDQDMEWNQKNKHRNSEYNPRIVYAECSLHYESYGWLVDVINVFGNKGGYEIIAQMFEGKDLDEGQMVGLLVPVAMGLKFLVKDIIAPMFRPAIEKAMKFITSLEDHHLKAKRMKYVYQLLEYIRSMCVSFWPADVERVTNLHLHMIIRMLKTPHFSSRMIALKELGIIISNSEKKNDTGIGMDHDFIQDWMTEKAVLSLALEGNLDQVQYTDRMKQLMEFMGPKMKEEELTKIWGLCEKSSAHVVDNIHRVMIAATTRFNPHQFDHLLKLIRKSWENGNDRLREKLLFLIGKIGQDSRLGRTAEKMLDTLWELARVSSLPPHLVHLAIEEHLHILNESVNRDQLRKSYIIRCVEDIRRSPAVYLPLKQLHNLAKSITRNSSSYFKSERQTLSDLNKSHEIVKLITQSLAKCHSLAVKVNKEEIPQPETLIDGKYSLSDYVLAHLEFLKFLLKDGDAYLAWPQCKELWDTLISNPKASCSDKMTCLVWFSQCLQDIEPNTQKDLFSERLLSMDASSMTPSAFNCFCEFFRVVNINDRKIIKSGGDKHLVDSLELHGLEFVWEIVLECVDQQLAEEAIRLLLDMSYLLLTMKLKKDPPQLHQRFISECYRKLENALMHVNQNNISISSTKAVTSMTVTEIASLSPSSKRTCLQHILRILIIVERYVSSIEEQHCGARILLPHAACFLGKPMSIIIKDDASNNQMTLQCHSNESLGSLYSKIAKGASISVEQLQQITFDREDLVENNDNCYSIICCNEQQSQLLHQFDLPLNASATVKINASSGAQLKEVGSTNVWNELPDIACYSETQDESSSSTLSTPRLATASTGANDIKLKEEKKLPGVVMAGFGKNVFNMLYQLTLLEDNRILDAVARVLYLIPTDPSVVDKMDSICAGSMSVASNVCNMNSSPINSPAKREKTTDKSKKREVSSQILKELLEVQSNVTTPFRLLYNLEILSCKVMPLSTESTVQNSSLFCEEFLSYGGLKILTSLLHRDSLPQEMNYEIRQNIYIIVLQLLSFLFSKTEHCMENPSSNMISSPYSDATHLNDKSSSVSIVAKVFEDLSCDEWLKMVNNLMRVTWASAAGQLYLCSSGLSAIDNNVSLSESFKSSRENSTGSCHSSGSENEKSFHSVICMQKTSLESTDALITIQALPLLITVLSLKPNFIGEWYSLPSVKEFIIELLIGCSSSDVRQKACEQFILLTKISTTIIPNPDQFLTKILLKARLPLWVSSTSARGATLRFIGQCSQYFDLSSKLLSDLSKSSQELLDINAAQMMEDEINWLTNFTVTREATRERPESGISTHRQAENILVAGHLSLITALLSCEMVDNQKCGEVLIHLLLSEYLFPAAKLILEFGQASDLYEESHNCSAKCTGKEARLSAYHLLSQLAVTSEKNLNSLCNYLISLHHKLVSDSLKEYECSPVVDSRCSSGYVGLKNGGATCYMNSVLQQLFLVPGVYEDILGINSDDEHEDSLFYELQSVFGHLLESQLQYFTPEKFWKCFRMGGQPVNIREQQDAFEFYSRLTEQVDDHLRAMKQDSIFTKRFEGIYSIQRICQDCPHRYEREEPFLALNLTVTKCNDLQDSLDQFVKGELLEGDNAYFCEKCNLKRTAIIRTCIKTLPPVLVIQLKRFGYDWEASRALKFDDYFKFPWIIDMSDYTVEALSDHDIISSPGKDQGNGEFLKMEPPKAQAKSLKKTPMKLSIPSSNKFSTPRKSLTTRQRYELVGVIVHSGQANAGHYYSYIKDRRGDTISNPNNSKWFKFNDTTVEHVEMSNSLLEQECFGGTYKAKVSYDSSNPMPEDRLRYWNGYLLFYESLNDMPCTPKTPKTPRSVNSSRSLRGSTNSVKKNLSLCVNDSKKLVTCNNIENLTSSPLIKKDDNLARAAQTSLCELSELLQQGEKKGMFKQQMPSRILATISHENLIFLRNRDLYSENYYSFVFNVCSAVTEMLKTEDYISSDMCVDTVSLGMKFLLNTYLRIREKDFTTVSKWLDLIITIIQANAKSCSWSLNFFTCEEGEQHLQPLLLDCPDKMVRIQMSTLISQILCSECKHSGTTDSVKKFLENILSMLSSEVPTAVKSSQQYFTLIQNYCKQGAAECEQVLKLDGFSSLISFLLGPCDSPKRRWSQIQSQDFGPLHSIIAELILNCKRDGNPQECDMEEDGNEKNFGDNYSLPSCIIKVLYGTLREKWLKEVVLAYREVVGGIPQLTEVLKLICTNDSQFSFALMTTIMNQYCIAPSNMLKDLSVLLVEILSIQDCYHTERVLKSLSGFTSANGSQVQGFLNVIELNKECDSRRAYQCIKLIITLSVQSSVARDHLTNTQTNWQWSVEWLKSKMDDHSDNTNMGYTSGLALFSNEDSNTKSFQRTTSAQWTLAEATALLSGMESTDMEIDCEQELAEIKESPESDNLIGQPSPSESH